MSQPTPFLSLASEEVAASDQFRHLSTIAGIAVDLRYASENNFVGRDLYAPFDCAWLHVEAATALENAVRWLAGQAPGHTLLVLDALRPQRVQQQLWDSLAGTGLQLYLADPARGSIHSYGMALDATIVDPQGRELDMGSGFDAMVDLSHPALEEGFLANGQLSAQQVANRALLRGALCGAGFVGINTEWWHFDCGDRVRVRASFHRVL